MLIIHRSVVVVMETSQKRPLNLTGWILDAPCEISTNPHSTHGYNDI